jgi:hypothetical protein
MSLEQALAENTAALNSLAAVMSKGGGAAPPTTSATATPAGDKRGPGRPKKITLEEVTAIAEQVRDEIGKDAAVSLINKHGAKKLSELDASKYAAFVAACQVALSDAGPAEGEEGEDASL